MSKKTIYLLLALSIGINLGVMGMTLLNGGAEQPLGPRPDGPRGEADRGPGVRPNPEQLVQRHLQGMTQHLELDAEQQQAVRLIMERYMPEQAERQLRVDQTSNQLSRAYAAPVFDAAQFRRLTEAASRAHLELDSLSTVMLVAEAEVLTPDQRRKFAAAAPTLRARRQGQRPDQGPPPR